MSKSTTEAERIEKYFFDGGELLGLTFSEWAELRAFACAHGWKEPCKHKPDEDKNFCSCRICNAFMAASGGDEK